MKFFDWNLKKNEKLKAEREISFEDVVYSIQHDGLLDILEHHKKNRFPHQRIFIVNVNDYAFLIREMFRQMPVFNCDSQGIATKGLIIRHLILPDQLDDSLKILEWIDQNCAKGVILSLMSQYKPCHKAPPSLQRTLRTEEYNRVVQPALALGLETLFIQPEPFKPEEHRIPDFERKNPFDWS